MLCIDNRRKLIEENSGSPLFYFNNADMLRLFLTDRVGLPKKTVSQLTLPQEEMDFTVFVRESDFNVVYFPNVARLICDPRNPLYDAEYAKANTLRQHLHAAGRHAPLPPRARYAARGAYQLLRR